VTAGEWLAAGLVAAGLVGYELAAHLWLPRL
jgi:hypothetical protein